MELSTRSREHGEVRCIAPYDETHDNQTADGNMRDQGFGPSDSRLANRIAFWVLLTLSVVPVTALLFVGSHSREIGEGLLWRALSYGHWQIGVWVVFAFFLLLPQC